MLLAGLTWDSMRDNLSGPPIPVRQEDGAGDMTRWVGLEWPLAPLSQPGFLSYKREESPCLMDGN